MKIFAIQNTGRTVARQGDFKYNTGSASIKYENKLQNQPCDIVSFGAREKVYVKTDPALKNVELVKSRGGIVPKRVEDLAREYAKDETLKNLTLTDVHKIAYQDLKRCKTLDEAKELFPEFECVLPADKVSAKEGSVVYGLQIGEVEVEPCGEKTDDETLKLLQYIWAELYSSSNAAYFTHNVSDNFYTVWNMQAPLSKLKIPLLNYEYSQSLIHGSRLQAKRLNK